MNNYKYLARDFTGQRKEGNKQAPSSSEVLNWLREQGYTPVSVTELTPESKKVIQKGKHKRIKSSDLGALCWQLTTMVEGGIPITTALEAVAGDVDNLQLRQILNQVLGKMRKGQPLSESMGEYPRVFNRLTCAIVLAGETSGDLADALRRLAQYFDNRDKLKKKVQGAMAYPIFVSVFIILIVIGIMTFIIPRFSVIFDQFGGDLPAFTKAFMAFYDAVRFNVLYILGTIFLLIVLGVFAFKTEKGHFWFCKFILGFPLLGKIFSHAFVIVFCRTMSTMIAAGVSVLEIFDILSVMTNNDIIKSAVTNSRKRIVEGANVSVSMQASGFFPNMVIKMIQVGEDSGSLSKVLERTADYYERKVDTIVTTLMNLLEPVMIVTIGGIVLVVVLALYMPIFTMGS